MNKYKIRRYAASLAFIGLCGAGGIFVNNALVANDSRVETPIVVHETTKPHVIAMNVTVVSSTTKTTTVKKPTTKAITSSNTTAKIKVTTATSEGSRTKYVDTVPKTTVLTEPAPTEAPVTTTVTSITNVTPTTECIPTTTEGYSDAVMSYVYNISEADRHNLAAVTFLEGRDESYECLKGICSTVINRHLTTGASIYSITHDANQYSVAWSIDSCMPSQAAYDAVDEVLHNGTNIPIYVKYFRASYYHNWGDQVPYMNLGNTYFSYSASERGLYE